jgi:uncharacterized DUF497 family protein
MDISFDPAKDARNIVLRGLSFARAVDFDWASALILEDAGITANGAFRRWA